MFRHRCQLSPNHGPRLALLGLAMAAGITLTAAPNRAHGALGGQPQQLDQLDLDGGHRVHLRYPTRCRRDLERLGPAIASQRRPSEIEDSPWQSISTTIELEIQPVGPGRRQLRMRLRFSGQGQSIRRELSDIDCGLLVDSAATLIALALDGGPERAQIWGVTDPPSKLATEQVQEPLGDPWVGQPTGMPAQPAHEPVSFGPAPETLELNAQPDPPTSEPRTKATPRRRKSARPRRSARPRKPPRRRDPQVNPQPKLQLAVGPGFAGGIAPGGATGLSLALELPRGLLRWAFALHTRIRPSQAGLRTHGLRLNLSEWTASFGLCLAGRGRPVFAEICLQPELGAWRVSATGTNRPAAAQWTPFASLGILPGLSYWPTQRFGLRLRTGVAVALLQPRFHAGTPIQTELAAKTFGYRSALELVFAI